LVRPIRWFRRASGARSPPAKFRGASGTPPGSCACWRRGGWRSAILYSIVVSCQRHDIDPAAYLRDVLGRLCAMTNQDDLTALLPCNWQPATAR